MSVDSVPRIKRSVGLGVRGTCQTASVGAICMVVVVVIGGSGICMLVGPRAAGPSSGPTGAFEEDPETPARDNGAVQHIQAQGSR